MKACGKVFKYGDNVDTDVIIPARHLAITDPKGLAEHCMEDIDADFVKNVKDGDIIGPADDLKMEVIGTPGHSAAEVSYRINDIAFIGDAVPVKGDIPIFIDVKKTRESLNTLENLSDVHTFYPAWDQTYSPEMMKNKITDAKALVNQLEETVRIVDDGMDILGLVDCVCDRLHMPMLKTNPLFARTVECCRKERE